MSSRITPQQYSQAVLEHVQSGAYPESEDLVSAELPPSALPEVSKFIEQARENVKVPNRYNYITKVYQLPVSRSLSGGIAETVPQTSMVG